MSCQVDSVNASVKQNEDHACSQKSTSGKKDNGPRKTSKKKSKKSSQDKEKQKKKNAKSKKVKTSGEDSKKLKTSGKDSKKLKTSGEDSFTGFLHECDMCNNVFFPSKSRLDEHLKQVHGIQRSSKDNKSDNSQVNVVKVLPLKAISKIKETGKASVLDDLCTDLRCNSCYTYFSTEENLKDHLEMHVCDAVAECPCCLTEVRTRNPHVRSIETQTLFYMYSCNDCDDRFEEEQELTWHRLKIHKIIPQPVQVSSRSRGRPRIPKAKLTCEVCSKVFKTHKDKIKHLKSHKNDKETILDDRYECNDYFSRTPPDEETQLGTHESIQSEPTYRTYSKVFNTLEEFQEHQNVHGNADDAAGETKLNTGHTENLNTTSQNGNGEAMFQIVDYSSGSRCDVCSEALESLKDIKEHQRLHSTTTKDAKAEPIMEYKYICEKCHLRTPDIEKHTCPIVPGPSRNETYACSDCGKLFTSVKLLQVHFKWHDMKRKERASKKALQSRRHICHVCGVSYGKKSHLNVHLKRHAGNKSYCCQYCDKKFYTSHNLKIHQWTHTGEKHYMCTHEGCFRRFTQRSHLTYHIKIHKKNQGQEAMQVKQQESTSKSDSINSTNEHLHSTNQKSSQVIKDEKDSQENVLESEGCPQEVKYEEVQTEFCQPESIFITEIHSYSEQVIGGGISRHSVLLKDKSENSVEETALIDIGNVETEVETVSS